MGVIVKVLFINCSDQVKKGLVIHNLNCAFVNTKNYLYYKCSMDQGSIATDGERPKEKK